MHDSLKIAAVFFSCKTLINTQKLIDFRRVQVRRGGVVVLSDISFQIAEGEKVTFRGKSGSGKTTLLKTLIGGEKIDSGQALFNGELISKKTIHQVRKSISYIGQEPVLGAQGVRDALLLPFSFKSHRACKPTEKAILAQLERLQLNKNILQRKSNEISGGEKQRIAIARGILLNKRIFIADEITSALDPESKTAVMNCLFKPDFTVISVSHDPDWVERCTRILTIENGRLKGEAGNGND